MFRAILNQVRFTPIPFIKQFARRQAAYDSRMGQSSKSQMWYMARSGPDTIKIPDAFSCLLKVVIKKPPCFVLSPDSRISPGSVLKRTDIKNINLQQIARLCPTHTNWA